MYRLFFAKTILAATAVAVSGFTHAETFSTRFSGFNEVGALNAETGAIASPGTGTLRLDLDKKAATIAYTLVYSGLSAGVTQAHIHLGKVHVPGGVMAFLCTNLSNGPAGTPLCPAAGGTVTGTITAADVVGPTAQNVTPGDFAALVDALDSNTVYGNIHTAKFPAGEIRGELMKGENDELPIAVPARESSAAAGARRRAGGVTRRIDCRIAVPREALLGVRDGW